MMGAYNIERLAMESMLHICRLVSSLFTKFRTVTNGKFKPSSRELLRLLINVLVPSSTHSNAVIRDTYLIY